LKILDDIEELAGILTFTLIVFLLWWLWKHFSSLKLPLKLPEFKGMGGGGGLKTDDRGKGKDYDPTFDPTFPSDYDIRTGIVMPSNTGNPDGFDPNGYTEEDLKREFPGAFS
jgi:hypothetical protein